MERYKKIFKEDISGDFIKSLKTYALENKIFNDNFDAKEIGYHIGFILANEGILKNSSYKDFIEGAYQKIISYDDLGKTGRLQNRVAMFSSISKFIDKFILVSKKNKITSMNLKKYGENICETLLELGIIIIKPDSKSKGLNNFSKGVKEGMENIESI